MKRSRFPRRAGIAAAVLAGVLVLAPAAFAQVDVHNFSLNGFTDIPVKGASVTDYASLISDPTAPRLVFNHDGPIRYEPNSNVLSVESRGGFFDLTVGGVSFISRLNIYANVDNSGNLGNAVVFDACGDSIAAGFCVRAWPLSDGSTPVLLRGNVKAFGYRYNNGAVTDNIDIHNNALYDACTLGDQTACANSGLMVPDGIHDYAAPSAFAGGQFPWESYDDLAFYIEINGGSLSAQYGKYIAVSVHSFTLHSYANGAIYSGPRFTGSFAPPPANSLSCERLNANNQFELVPGCSFGGGVLGVMGKSMLNGFLADPCDGKVSGSVLNALTGAGLDAATILVKDDSTSAALQGDPGPDGSFFVSGLCQGSYKVYATPPSTDWAAADGYPTVVPMTVSMGSPVNVASPNPINFKFALAISSNFVTFGQGGWGAKPKGMNPGYLLKTYYAAVYGSDPVVIGGPRTVTMTGFQAIQNFLPQGGRPLPLPPSGSADGNYVDPAFLIGHRRPHNRLGSLAGETLAAQLNVDFSNASFTRFGLGSQLVAAGPFLNCTVRKVLAHGNSVLGGGPLLAGMKYDDVEDTLERINQNYEGGRARGYLVASLPASTPACRIP